MISVKELLPSHCKNCKAEIPLSRWRGEEFTDCVMLVALCRVCADYEHDQVFVNRVAFSSNMLEDVDLEGIVLVPAL